jgi:hypothetical protein
MTKHKRTKLKKHTMGQQLYKLFTVPRIQSLKSYIKPLYDLTINIPIFYKNHPEKTFHALIPHYLNLKALVKTLIKRLIYMSLPLM